MKMRLNSLLLLVVLLCSSTFQGQEKTLFHRAKIFYSTADDIQLLSSLGLEMDHGSHKKGVFVESDYSVKELQLAEEAGFQTEIVIQDVQSYYVHKNKTAEPNDFNKNFDCVDSDIATYATPDNFELGSMGGFFTYEEILAELDEMASLYPNLISSKSPISDFETFEGREIFWMRMSNNPNVDQDKPEMLYDAIHHAREPASVSSLIYYMWYLLENYETDEEVQAILDNSELYFVPVINPDGYVYNVTTNPDGGGLWRKNRRDNGDGEFGVDNNRNYGHEWGTTGITFDTDGQTYCGTEAFSFTEWICKSNWCQPISCFRSLR